MTAEAFTSAGRWLEPVWEKTKREAKLVSENEMLGANPFWFMLSNYVPPASPSTVN